MEKKIKKKTPKVLILDIDGCLNIEYPSLILNKNHKLISKDPYGPLVWNMFKESVNNIKAKPQFLPFYYFPVFKNQFEKVYIITARLEEWRSKTEEWLKKWGFNYDTLYMRPSKYLKLESYKFKKIIAQKHILSKYSSSDCVACDDDKSICLMYEELGIRAYQAPIDWTSFITDFKLIPPKLTKSSNHLLKYYLTREYKKNKTLKGIAQELGCRYKSILSLKKDLNLIKRPTSGCHKKINIEPFKYLNTEVSAYIAGFTATSGSIEIRSAGKVGIVKWNHEEDLLKQIKTKLKVQQPVYKSKSKAELSVFQASLANLLVHRWGIPSNTLFKVQFPRKVPTETLPHFIRGVFDGGGCITTKGKVIISSISKNFIMGISATLNLNNIDHILSTKRNSQSLQNMVYIIELEDSLSLQKFYTYIYQKSSISLEKQKKQLQLLIN